MSKDILDIDPFDIPEIRDIPEGEYRGNVVDYVIKENSNGKTFVQFSFRLGEPLSGQDMTGVQTNLRVFSKRIYLTEESLKYSARDLEAFGVPKQSPMRNWIEAIPGSDVQFRVSVEKNESTGREYRTVTSWRAAS